MSMVPENTPDQSAPQTPGQPAAAAPAPAENAPAPATTATTTNAESAAAPAGGETAAGDAGDRPSGDRGRGRRRRGGRGRRRPDGEGGSGGEGAGDSDTDDAGNATEGADSRPERPFRHRSERGERGDRGGERGERGDRGERGERPRPPRRNDDYSAAPRHANDLRSALGSDDYAKLDAVAERYGREWGTKPPWVKNRFSTFQIRAIVGEMERLKRADFVADESAQQSLRLLKPQVSYLARRYHDDDLYEFCRIVRFCVDEVGTDAQKFRRFADLFSALLAYFRANGGR